MDTTTIIRAVAGLLAIHPAFGLSPIVRIRTVQNSCQCPFLVQFYLIA
jgi:hypothetical protein